MTSNAKTILTRRSALWGATALGLLTQGFLVNSTPSQSDDFVELRSPHPFALTVDKLSAAIAGAGLGVMARIDHAAGAAAVGLTMPPTLVLLYGNARGGTPIMLAQPAAALDLPPRVLVREDAAGTTWVAFHPIVALLTRAGASPDITARLVPAQRLLVDALST